MNTLKIFACDHRNLHGKTWKYDAIRIGTGFNNDCELKDINGETICTLENDKLLSEYTAIWWIWKHISELDNPDYIGFCHYRRFFTLCKPNYGVFPIVNIPMAYEYPYAVNAELKHDNMLKLITQYNADGIIPIPFPDYSYCKYCNDVIQLMINESNFLNLKFTVDHCNMMFSELKQSMKSFFTDDIISKSFLQTNTFHFNLFVLNSELFDIYNKIMNDCISKIINNLKIDNQLYHLHQRSIAYATERFSSCIFFAMIFSGKKFIQLPMLMIDNKQE